MIDDQTKTATLLKVDKPREIRVITFTEQNE